MKSLKDILGERPAEKGVYSKYEFQAFGYELARTLGDLRHKALYIKLAKEEPRERLIGALDFVKDSKARSKAKLFMWKLASLRAVESPKVKI